MTKQQKSPRPLTRTFLKRLGREFPFLADWHSSEFHGDRRDVNFKVVRMLDAGTTWKLEYGRYNNRPDSSYTCGVTHIAISDGNSLVWKALLEGETKPEDVIDEKTSYILVRYEYRSQLIRDEPGFVEYTLYKRGQQTYKKIVEGVDREVADMSATLAEA